MKEPPSNKKEKVSIFGGGPIDEADSDVLRKRKEAQAAEDTRRRAELSANLMKERKKKLVRERELKVKRRKLVNKLDMRPRDQKSLIQLINVAYELEDYFSVCTLIKRAQKLHPDERNHAQYMRLGRCSMRRWSKDGEYSDITTAVEAYGNALHDPIELMRPLANPLYFFEYVGVLIRCRQLDNAPDTDTEDDDAYLALGCHQVAIDLLGAMVSRWSDDYGIMMMCQYLMAQILCVRGDYEEAYQIYQDRLLLCPMLLQPLEEYTTKDAVVTTSVRMISILVQLEAAVIQKKLGMFKVCVGMMSEAFMRQERNGPVELADGSQVDIRFGHTKFQEWVSSPETFSNLCQVFRKQGNVSAAADMAAVAADLCSKEIQKGKYDNAGIPRSEKKRLCSFMLDRGEALAELCVFGGDNGSEVCAHYAYNMLEIDVVVTGRAARCVLANKPKNQALIKASKDVGKAVALVSRILLFKVSVRRKQARLALGEFATTINAAIRMSLVRNRHAADLLSVTPTFRIGNVIRYFRKCLWKSGRLALEEWTEFWDTSVNIIQRGLWRWYIRKQQSRQIRGVNVLKRLWRGQVVRRALRDKVEAVQEELEDGLECGNGQYSFYFDTVATHRMSAAVTVLTGHQNAHHDRIQQQSMEDNGGSWDDSLADQIVDDFEDSEEVKDGLSPMLGMAKTSSQASPLDRRGREGDMGKNLFSSKSESSILTKKGAFLPSNGSDEEEYSLRLKPRGYYNGADAHSSSSSYLNGLQGHSSSAILSHKAAIPISSALVSQAELESHVASAHLSGEDIISLVSLRSVKDDPSLRWIPFAILPNPAIARLLTCTALVITSPSFCFHDIQRIVYMCKRFPHLWMNIRSLFVYGTSLNRGRGLSNLLNLGFVNMHTLSIGQLGITATFGTLLGDLLIDTSEQKKRKTPSSLTKLYIEDEHSFGDAGMINLVKRLQFNSSMRLLSVRNCKLTKKSSGDLSRYVGVSANLEILNVNDNLFNEACCRQFLRAVANKGIKGNFSALHCTGTQPALSHEQVVSILKEGMNLNVNVISGEIDTGGAGFRAELTLQKEFKKEKGFDIEAQKMKTVQDTIEEITRYGTIEDWEKISQVGVKSAKALYL